ncbi:hypothetical protein CJU90_5693 [Yarrowia sp. C11]|nr:hypothetical protein CJU90_5693 [Yarrowia sp. C11]KAG5364277.1 hypothetical protein CKK34_3071 [Yarrowia sp. E02]
MQQQLSVNYNYYAWKWGFDSNYVEPQFGVPYSPSNVCGCKGPYFVGRGRLFNDQRAARSCLPSYGPGATLETFKCIKDVRKKYGNGLKECFSEQLTHWNQLGLVVNEVYTGSCLHNAAAGYGVYFGKNNGKNKSQRVPAHRYIPTSRVAELLAISAALAVISDLRDEQKWVVYTDSDWALQSLSVSYKRWKRSGWTDSTGRPVPNRDVFEQVLYQLDGLPKVSLEKTRVKGDCEGGNYAGQLAKEACREW